MEDNEKNNFALASLPSVSDGSRNKTATTSAMTTRHEVGVMASTASSAGRKLTAVYVHRSDALAIVQPQDEHEGRKKEPAHRL